MKRYYVCKIEGKFSDYIVDFNKKCTKFNLNDDFVLFRDDKGITLAAYPSKRVLEIMMEEEAEDND